MRYGLTKNICKNRQLSSAAKKGRQFNRTNLIWRNLSPFLRITTFSLTQPLSKPTTPGSGLKMRSLSSPSTRRRKSWSTSPSTTRKSRKKNRRRKKNEKKSAFYGVFIWAFLFCFNSYLFCFRFIAFPPRNSNILIFIQYMNSSEWISFVLYLAE